MSETISAMNSAIKNPEISEMFAVGAHFGFSRSRRHPSVKDFIFGYKNNSAVINLEKTVEMLAKAEKFFEELGREKKTILFVGTKNEARNTIQSVAEKLDMPYVIERWIGGTFTNFKAIKTRTERLTYLKDQEATGGLDIYTKKERNVIMKEVSDLKRYFAGIEHMTKIPAAMFVIDPKEESIAVDEATKLNVPIVALSNSDCDLNKVSFPIVANDASLASIKYFASRMAAAYDRGLKDAPAPTEEATKKEEVKEATV